MKKLILAADLGGTNIRIAAVDEVGRPWYRARSGTPVGQTASSIKRLIADIAAECMGKLGGDASVASFALAAPAVIDRATGTILAAPNLPELNGFAICRELSSELGLPVLVENDATAAAIGENWLGASRGAANSICLTLGTGVGGGLIIGGNPYRGIDGTAGEIGHVCVEPFGVQCGCGSLGCLEQYSSASAVVRMTRELMPEFEHTVLRGNNGLTSLDVYDAGAAGDPLAVEVFRRFGFYLGIVLGGLVNVLNPEVIVLGGGASEGWDLFIETTRQEMRKRAFQQPAERVKLVRAELGDDAGILGVARLALQV